MSSVAPDLGETYKQSLMDRVHSKQYEAILNIGDPILQVQTSLNGAAVTICPVIERETIVASLDSGCGVPANYGIGTEMVKMKTLARSKFPQVKRWKDVDPSGPRVISMDRLEHVAILMGFSVIISEGERQASRQLRELEELLESAQQKITRAGQLPLDEEMDTVAEAWQYLSISQERLRRLSKDVNQSMAKLNAMGLPLATSLDHGERLFKRSEDGTYLMTMDFFEPEDRTTIYTVLDPLIFESDNERDFEEFDTDPVFELFTFGRDLDQPVASAIIAACSRHALAATETFKNIAEENECVQQGCPSSSRRACNHSLQDARSQAIIQHLGDFLEVLEGSLTLDPSEPSTFRDELKAHAMASGRPWLLADQRILEATLNALQATRHDFGKDVCEVMLTLCRGSESKLQEWQTRLDIHSTLAGGLRAKSRGLKKKLSRADVERWSNYLIAYHDTSNDGSSLQVTSIPEASEMTSRNGVRNRKKREQKKRAKVANRASQTVQAESISSLADREAVSIPVLAEQGGMAGTSKAQNDPDDLTHDSGIDMDDLKRQTSRISDAGFLVPATTEFGGSLACSTDRKDTYPEALEENDHGDLTPSLRLEQYEKEHHEILPTQLALRGFRDDMWENPSIVELRMHAPSCKKRWSSYDVVLPLGE